MKFQLIFILLFSINIFAEVNLSINTVNYLGDKISTVAYDGDYNYYPRMDSIEIIDSKDKIQNIKVNKSNTQFTDPRNPNLKLTKFDINFEITSDFNSNDSIFRVRFIIRKPDEYTYYSNQFYILKNEYKPKISLLTPNNNAKDISVFPTFKWTKDSYALTNYFQIVISENLNLTNPEVLENIADSIFIPKNKLKPDTKYYWSVQKTAHFKFKFDTIYSFKTGYDTTWNKISNSNSYFQKVLLNSNDFLLASTSNGLIKSSNGINWEKRQLTSTNERIISMFKFSNDTVIILGLNLDLPEPKYFIAKTDNFGDDFLNIKYLDDDKIQYHSNIFINLNKDLFILSDSLIIKYEDFGLGNRKSDTIINNSINSDMKLLNNGNILLFTSKGADYYDYSEIYESTDQGNSWKNIFNYEGYYDYKLVSAGLSKDNIIYASYKNHPMDEGYIIFSIDLGKSFTKLNKKSFYYVNKFVSASNGNLYILKSNTYDQIDYSSDNCSTFQKFDHDLPENMLITDLIIYKGKYLLAFSENGSVFKRQVRSSDEVPLFPNDTSINPDKIKFMWHNENNSNKYQFQLYFISKIDLIKNNDLNLVVDTTISNNFFEYNINSNDLYYWRTRALTNLRWTNWTDFNIFSTEILNVDYQGRENIIIPNPANNFIYINFPFSDTKSDVKIFNSFGILQKSPLFDKTHTKIDISMLHKGVYFILIGNNFHKFIKY